MEQKTVNLYTRQNDKTLYQLERNGRIINERIYVELHFGDIAPLFMESYDWFTREAAKKVAKPEDVKAPIWCSISPDNCLKPIPDTVVYVLEVPQDQIIYFDDVKWDYVLNRIYLPKDDEDAAAYKPVSYTHLDVYKRQDVKTADRARPDIFHDILGAARRRKDDACQYHSRTHEGGFYQFQRSHQRNQGDQGGHEAGGGKPLHGDSNRTIRR